MPFSADEGKAWTAQRIRSLNPEFIVDIGPGSGTYSRLLRKGLRCHWTGIEIFEPYIERYDLMDWYDAIFVQDVRTFEIPEADVIILGDVLEHMTLDEAKDVWNRSRAAARDAVFLSLPIIEYPQGEFEGNIHETHLHTWSHELVLSELDGIVDSATYTQIGVYQADGYLRM